MTGEERAWLELSLRLHKTPAEVMHQVTWVDFLRYQKIFEEEINLPTKDDWYAAQIAYELFCVSFRVWGKHPPTHITVKNFLMKFGAPDPVSREAIDEATEQEIIENYTQLEMLKWSLAMGVPLPGEPMPEDDGSPVRTMLPPDMAGKVRPAQEAGLPAAFPAAEPAPVTAGLPPAGFVPRGKGRRNRGH
jgi:hypothetical protein